MLCAVLLAAGAGERFQGPTHKLLAEFRGRPLYQHALEHVVRADIGPVIVVTGAVDLELPADILHVHHRGWRDGQAGSLLAGIAAARQQGATSVVVGLADQPFVAAAAWQAIAESDPAYPMAVARYADGIGPNPVRLADSVWPLLSAGGDHGARHLIRAHPEWVTEVSCVGSAADIDTVEDAASWTS